MMSAIVEVIVTGSWVSTCRFTLFMTSTIVSTIGIRMAAFTRAMKAGEISGRSGTNRNLM